MSWTPITGPSGTWDDPTDDTTGSNILLAEDGTYLLDETGIPFLTEDNPSTWLTVAPPTTIWSTL